MEIFRVEMERELMESEDVRSRAMNLTYINSEILQEITILQEICKKIEKKVRKINL